MTVGVGGEGVVATHRLCCGEGKEVVATQRLCCWKHRIIYPEWRLALVEADTVLDGAEGGWDQADGVGPHVRCGEDPGEDLELGALPSGGGCWDPEYCVATTEMISLLHS